MSPTIPVKGKGAQKYAFKFFSSDILERPHVHIYRENKRAKIWLQPVLVEWNRGYNDPELGRILKLVQENQGLLLEAWIEHFAKK
ncbi:MAG: DUF4160 domain-containing protein [Anaerolineales bacterium]|nr:DUF4160 domain-containing protein [Anaerolineales bacterium]